MISFCHGQEHQANNHKHLLLVTDDISQAKRLIAYLDKPQYIDYGMRLELDLQNMEAAVWVLPPDYGQSSIVRRLLKTINLVVLLYSQNNYSSIEEWLDKFTITEEKILTLIDDFDLLERMNIFHGKLISSSSFKREIKSSLIEN